MSQSKSRSRPRLSEIAAACLFSAVATGAAAQGFPNKPLRLIVSFVPGGPTDIVARVVAGKMSEGLGQPILV